MSKYCVKCGAELKEGVKFCDKCGNPADGVIRDGTTSYNSSSGGSMAGIVTNRNIGLAIILSFLTCGIYALIWMVYINDDVNRISDDTDGMSSALVLLLTIITCGCFGAYWGYVMGQKLLKAGQKYNVNISDNSVVYIILPFIGLGIVNYCIIQSDLNKLS